MNKLRWAMDGGFWDLDMATSRTVDGCARAVPGDPLPLSLSRGKKLSRPKQLDFMHRFMSMPLVPCYAGDLDRGGHGFSFQRAISIPFGENWFSTLIGQFHLQKFMSSFIDPASKKSTESPWVKSILRHLCDKSLYALGFSSEILFEPDSTVLLSSEFCNGKAPRMKAVLHHELPQHDLTVEGQWPGLFIDGVGNYWDVPFTLAVDLASVANSSSSYHLFMQHNVGKPERFDSDAAGIAPSWPLPGLSFTAACSSKKDVDIWKKRGGKLKMVQPYDIFMSDPHVSASGIIGAVLSASFRNNSDDPPTEQGSQLLSPFSSLAWGSRSDLCADLFASFTCSAQYGNFQRLFFDLTRANARIEFPSGSKFIAGVVSLTEKYCKSQQLNLEEVRAVCPNVLLSFQQQIAGPVSIRVDSRISLDSKLSNQFAQVDETIFAVEYAMKVLGSAKATAWYSAKHKEFMVDLRFFES